MTFNSNIADSMTKPLRTVVLTGVAILTLLMPVLGEEATTDKGWTQLFNGRDLDSWYTYLKESGKNQDPEHVFQVHDGIIHLYRDCDAAKPAPVGYFASNAEYSFYHLRFQYKWGGKRFAPRADSVRDTGLLYHAVGDDTIWPRSIECQVQEHDTGDCYLVYGTQVDSTVDPETLATGEFRFLDAATGGVPVTRGSPEIARIVKGSAHEEERWNTVEVIVRGSEGVTHIINGHVNFRATNLRKLGTDGTSWSPLTHGRIVFQAEYSEVLYRNIEIREIPDGSLLPIDSHSSR